MTEKGDMLGLPLGVVEDGGAGFLAWASDPMKTFLDERKEATFVEIMEEKAKRLGLHLVA